MRRATHGPQHGLLRPFQMKRSHLAASTTPPGTPSTTASDSARDSLRLGTAGYAPLHRDRSDMTRHAHAIASARASSDSELNLLRLCWACCVHESGTRSWLSRWGCSSAVTSSPVRVSTTVTPRTQFHAMITLFRAFTSSIVASPCSAMVSFGSVITHSPDRAHVDIHELRTENSLS